jgi:hypothetical protein
MTSSSFDFRAYLTNIFALLKLATLVVEVIYQTVKKKV